MQSKIKTQVNFVCILIKIRKKCNSKNKTQVKFKIKCKNQKKSNAEVKLRTRLFSASR